MIEIDKGIHDAILKTIDGLGSQMALVRLCGIKKSHLNHIVTGKIKKIELETWNKLYPHIKDNLFGFMAMWKSPEVMAQSLDMSKKLKEFSDNMIMTCMNLELDLRDKGTLMILEYWRDLSKSNRFELLKVASEIFEKQKTNNIRG